MEVFPSKGRFVRAGGGGGGIVEYWHDECWGVYFACLLARKGKRDKGVFGGGGKKVVIMNS